MLDLVLIQVVWEDANVLAEVFWENSLVLVVMQRICLVEKLMPFCQVDREQSFLSDRHNRHITVGALMHRNQTNIVVLINCMMIPFNKSWPLELHTCPNAMIMVQLVFHDTMVL